MPEVTFAVSARVLASRHVHAIDAKSPWPIYLWFVNAVTYNHPNSEIFDGVVLGGKPVAIQQIAQQLGMPSEKREMA